MIDIKSYEMIREIFNSCSNNQMRDIFFSEVETEDVESLISPYLTGESVRYEKFITPEGIVFDIVSGGVKQKITFTEI